MTRLLLTLVLALAGVTAAAVTATRVDPVETRCERGFACPPARAAVGASSIGSH